MNNSNNNHTNEPIIVKQVPFEISLDTYEKLQTGEYKQYGGTIRHALGKRKGQIVELLKPVDQTEADSEIEADEMNEVWEQFVQFIKEHKLGAAIAVIVTSVGTGLGLWLVFREPKYVKCFKIVFAKYIDEIRNGNLTIDTINLLMDSIEEMKTHKRYKKKLLIEEIEVFVNEINRYTFDLLENNNIECTENELTQSDDCIINLENYLEKQQKLFEGAM